MDLDYPRFRSYEIIISINYHFDFPSFSFYLTHRRQPSSPVVILLRVPVLVRCIRPALSKIDAQSTVITAQIHIVGDATKFQHLRKIWVKMH
jgi:hypothetical protein